MAIRVEFEGGPRDGQAINYRVNPRSIGCSTEARAKGMHGLYRTPRNTWGTETSPVVATWYDMAPKGKKQ